MCTRGFVTYKEADGERQHHIIDKCGSQDEQDRSGGKERQKSAPFVPIESWRNEQPQLGGNDRKRKTEPGKHPQLHIREESLIKSCIDQMVVGLACERAGERRRQKSVDVFRKTEAKQKADKESHDGDDEPLAQLDQVVEQWRLG